MSTAAAIVLFVGIVAYALFGGADFGAGFWDLVAGGTRKGERPRALIDHAIAPVWEANHVWLIFCFVVLWTCFPEAYASITLTMFVPLTLAAIGIVLRGASFAFRKAVLRTSSRRNFGAAFAISSVVVPYCFGSVIGGIASGRVPSVDAPAIRSRAGSIRRRSSRGCSRSWSPRTSPPRTSSGMRAGCRTTTWSRTSVAGPSARRSWPASPRSRGSSSSVPTLGTSSTGSPRGHSPWWWSRSSPAPRH